MKILIAGSRGYPNRKAVREFVRTLPPDSVVLTGGAVGVDTVATQEALACDLPFITYKPAWALYGRKAGPMRNKLMVDDADRIVCFWDGESRGTLSTIRYAKRSGKPLVVFHSDGSELSPDAY
jgi:predicted Rossmann fold nucleotide-binding protein DprA/Smf involved in DNA uptake